MSDTLTPREQEVWSILEQLQDPEIPVLTITELGIVKNVKDSDNGIIDIYITPTYSGCPAMSLIEMQIKAILESKGYSINIIQQLSPAWTTDSLSDEAKKKLEEYGIAPPQKGVGKMGLISGEDSVRCPRCKSENTELVSEFSGTSCKAMFRCKECLEPFEYFKCH